jgi:hypothetical protein
MRAAPVGAFRRWCSTSNRRANVPAFTPPLMDTPERTTAAVIVRYARGEVVADSAALQWPGLFARHHRFPRVVDRFLVPATPEPLIACTLSGSAEFEERNVGQAWVTRHLRRGDLFVTHSRPPTSCNGIHRRGRRSRASPSTWRWSRSWRLWKRRTPVRRGRWK